MLAIKLLVRNIMDGNTVDERDVQNSAMSSVGVGIATASRGEAIRSALTYHGLTVGLVRIVLAD